MRQGGLFVGSLSEDDGADVLLEAIELFPGVRIAVSEHGDRDRMSKAAYLVVPGVHRSVPREVIEAFAQGVPVIAARAGIRVFATGGIGGVHRGDTGDVSHDLVALARTPIAVVSAGAKAILDLPRTIEVLETLGVLVIGYRTAEFPAFYTGRSGVPLDHRVDTAAELAAIARARWDELEAGGILICNPIPEAAALDATSIDIAIATALAEATAARISGKQLTPFLLSRLAQATGGASIRANRALALHNAEVASALAVALAS
jgi:pseudouridine-5'-phosphate glycosidase